MVSPVLTGKRVFVAGHNGMVGSAIVRRLGQESCETLVAGRSDLDLLDPAATKEWLLEHRPDVMFVAAARVGGIQANNTRPVDFLHENLAIAQNTISGAHAADVEKVIFLGSSCIYPKFAEQPIKESELLTGALEPTNEWYAIAKIAGIKLCQAYRKQFNRNYISAMPCNLYGIGDNFDLTSSHVLPALIRKAHQAKLAGEDLVVWGSGTPLREFLNADDAADALVFLAQHYDGYEHVNVGSNSDLSIAELAKTIARIVGYKGPISFDSSKPDGTPRKLMDSSVLNNMGWSPSIPLDEGIRQTYEHFLEK